MNSQKAHSLPFLEAMDEYLAEPDRERTPTKGYSAPETLGSYIHTGCGRSAGGWLKNRL